MKENIKPNFITIESDGTPMNTKILDSYGKIIRGVQKVTWVVEAEKPFATVTLEITAPLSNIKFHKLTGALKNENSKMD